MESHRERFEQDPSDGAAFQALEEQSFLAGEWESLVRLYELRLRALGESQPGERAERARVVFRFGQALEEGFDDLDRALECYREASRLDADFEPARRRLRQLLISQGDWDDALTLMEQEAGRADVGRRVALRLEIAELCFGQAADPARAVEAYEAVIRDEPRNATAFLGRARALEAAQLYEEAVRAWEEAIHSLEDEAQGEAYRSLLEFLRSREAGFNRAVEVCWRAHGERGGEAEWIEALAELLAKQGRWEELAALSEERLARASSPRGRAAIAVEVGNLFAERFDDCVAARRWFARAAEWYESSELHLALADLAARESDESARASHLTRAMELGGELPSSVPAPAGGIAEAVDASPSLVALRERAQANPEDTRVVKALCEALETQGRYAELVTWLERRVALAHDRSDERAQLLERIGEIRERELDDRDGAEDAYQMCFTIDPSRATVVAALRRVLDRVERAPELAEILERAAEAADPEARVALWVALGELRLGVSQIDEALSAFHKALELEPEDPAALTGLRAAAERCEDAASRLRALESEVAIADAERMATIAPEIARLCRERDQIERALPALRRFAQSDATGRDALELLADTLADAGHTDELVLTLEELDGRLEGAARACNRRRLGYLHAAEGRPELAIQAWRGALEADPKNPGAAEALVEAVAEYGRPAELLEVLDKFWRPPETRSCRVALLHANALEAVGDLQPALAAYRELWQAHPNEAEAQAGCERVARALDDAEALAWVLGMRLRTGEDNAERDRVALEHAVLMEERLARQDAAREAYERLCATTAEPAIAEEALRRLTTLLEASGEWHTLCDHLERIADAKRGTAACDIHVRIAELAEAELGDLGRARRHLESAVAHRPDHAELWQRLAGCFDEETQPADLYRVLCGELEAPALEPRRLPLHAQAARLCAEAFADPDAAEFHYREVLKREPGQAEAIAFLLDQYAEMGDQRAAEELLRGQLQKTEDGAGATRLRLALAELLAGRTETRDEAIALFESLRGDGDTPPSLADQLAPLYLAAGRALDGATLCEATAAQLEDSAAASLWWRRGGEMRADADDPEGAVRAYERALEGAPEPAIVREPLVALYRKLGHHLHLAESLEVELAQLAGRAVPGARERDLHAELADLYAGALARPEQALEHYEALAALEPAAPLWRDRALALAEQLELPERMLPLLQAAASTAPPARRGALRLRLATLLDQTLERPEAAIAAYRDALRAAPDLGPARGALRRLLIGQERYAEALAVFRDEVERAPLERQLELVEEAIELALGHLDADALRPWLARLEVLAEAQPELLIRLASLRAKDGDAESQERALAAAARALDPERDRDRLCDLHLERAKLLRACEHPSRAIAALEKARALAPRHPDVLRGLAELYHGEERLRDLLAIFEVRLEEAQPAERAELQASLAELCTHVLWEPSRAAPLWSALLNWESPELGRPAETLPAIRRVYEAVRDWDHWARVAEVELRHAARGSHVELRGQLAELYRTRLGRPRDALPHLRILIDHGSADPVQTRTLLALLLREGRFVEWARRAEAHLSANPDDLPMWLEVASVRDARLADPTGASAAYREVTKRDASSEEAWAGLVRIAERTRDWHQLDVALSAQLGLGCVPAAPTCERLGELRLRRTADLRGAREALVRARELDAENRTTLRLLRETAQAQCCDDEVAALYREEIAQLPDLDAAPLWLALARHERDRCGRHDAAADAFAQADACVPLGAAELSEWAGTLERADQNQGWIEVFERWCDHPQADSAPADHLAAARGLVEAGRREAALERLERGLALDPTCAAGWSLTAELHEGGGDCERAAEAWRRAAGGCSGPEAARYLERCAQNTETAEPTTALEIYRAAVAEDPTSSTGLAGVARLAATHDQPAAARQAALQLLACAPSAPERAPLRDAFAAGARAALALEEWSRADQLASAILEAAPEDPEALWTRGRALFEMGNWSESGRDLERIAAVDAPVAATDRALFLEQLGLCRKAAGQFEQAIEPLREAIARAPGRESAQRSLAEILEHSDRFAEAAQVYADWAAHSATGRKRAEHFDRAAQLRGRAEPDAEIVEAWLRESAEADPTYAPPRLALVHRLIDAERIEEAIEEAGRGAARLAERSCVAELETLRGQLLERRRDHAAALEAFRRAAELNPAAIEAARSAARLLRAAGDWEGAAALLRNFCAVCPQDSRCGEAYLELGRLLAGPLEDIPGAIDAYRRARELAPGRDDVREALADLLAQFPTSSREATAEHITLLRAQPIRLRSIRALISIAERDRKRTPARRGMSILACLGVLSVYEREMAETRIEQRIGRHRPELSHLGAALQKGIQAAGPFWSDLLPEFDEPLERKHSVTAPLTAFREAYLAAETELLAPGWLALDDEALREAMRLACRAASGTATSEALVQATTRVRRRLRKNLADLDERALASFDAQAWRTALEIHALAIAVDATGGDLRAGLLFALARASDGASLEFGSEVDLTPWLHECPTALGLVARAIGAWLDSL